MDVFRFKKNNDALPFHYLLYTRSGAAYSIDDLCIYIWMKGDPGPFTIQYKDKKERDEEYERLLDEWSKANIEIHRF